MAHTFVLLLVSIFTGSVGFDTCHDKKYIIGYRTNSPPTLKKPENPQLYYLVRSKNSNEGFEMRFIYHLDGKSYPMFRITRERDRVRNICDALWFFAGITYCNETNGCSEVGDRHCGDCGTEFFRMKTVAIGTALLKLPCPGIHNGRNNTEALLQEFCGTDSCHDPLDDKKGITITKSSEDASITMYKETRYRINSTATIRCTKTGHEEQLRCLYSGWYPRVRDVPCPTPTTTSLITTTSRLPIESPRKPSNSGDRLYRSPGSVICEVLTLVQLFMAAFM